MMAVKDRLARLAVLIGIGTAAFVLTSSVQAAQPGQSAQPLVSLRLVDADLRTAVNLLMQQAGVNILFEPSEKPYAPVTVSLTDKPLDKALEYIARSAGAVVRRGEDGVFMVGPKGSEPVVAQQPVIDETPIVQAPTPVYREEKMRLQYVTPSEMLKTLRTDPSIIGQDWAAREGASLMSQLVNAQKSGPRSRAISKPEPLVAVPQPRVSGLPSANDGAGIAAIPDTGLAQMGRLGGGMGGGMTGGGMMGGMGGGMTGGGMMGGMGGMTGGGMMGGMGGMGGGMTGGGMMGGMGGGMGGLGGGMGGMGGGLFDTTGINAIFAIDVDNSLIVRGTDEGIERLRKIIRMIDVAPRQVEVKAEFVTVSISEQKKFGIDWLVQQINTAAGNTPGSFAVSDNPIFIRYSTGNLVTELRTLLNNSRGRVVQAPIITTMNNVPATIQVQRQIPYWTSTVQSGNSGPNITTTELQTLDVNTGLTVSPRINGDGSITLAIPLQLSDIGELRRGPNGEQVPDLISQSIFTTRRIRNGETVVLGGFVRRSDTRSVGKFPLLADLPLIGQLFRSTDNDTNDSELLIFLTVRIIDEQTGAAGSGVTP